MMAAVGHKILAAPFSIVGSIGVVAQIPNVHRLLKKNHIDVEQMTAGEYKRTVSLLGETTEKGRQKLQEELEETHGLFKQFISHYRPSLDIDKIATGEHWLGTKAFELNLVDSLITSDDYLLEKSKTMAIFEISYIIRKSLSERLASSVRLGIEKLLYSQTIF